MAINDMDALDRSDMERLMAGHDAALNDLMERHAPAVFNFLCRMLGNEAEAQDLAQDTFVRIYQARQRYQPERKFSTWLFTIAANLARDQFRARTRHPQTSLDEKPAGDGQTLGETLPADHASPAQELLAAERAEAVRAAVNGLPDDLREALILCEWEEFSMAEAANVLETTVKAIESRLYRSRQQLRERLARWGPNDQ
jgi:RNA polymerase sigma-70 factor, ECF subfamily